MERRGGGNHKSNNSILPFGTKIINRLPIYCDILSNFSDGLKKIFHYSDKKFSTKRKKLSSLWKNPESYKLEFRQKENCSLDGCKLQKSFIHFFQLLSLLPMPTHLWTFVTCFSSISSWNSPSGSPWLSVYRQAIFITRLLLAFSKKWRFHSCA